MLPLTGSVTTRAREREKRGDGNGRRRLEVPVLAAEEHKDDVVVVVIALGDDGDDDHRAPCPAFFANTLLATAGAVPATAGAATVSSPIWPRGAQIRPLRRRIWRP
uniref:Uncharacterized protein n=1 Tax=Oryza nivara TaxID=4536 RepID=A0A0E0IBY4_ORYNI